MPYIPMQRRYHARAQPTTPGELNFAITCLLIKYLDRQGLSYAKINDCVGALICAKDEFTRRIVAPYEDAKRAENEDVFP